MNLAQPEGEEGDGSEEEEDDMEMPPPPPPEEEEVVVVAATTAVAGERGMEALTDPALTGCLLTGGKLEGGSARGHPDWEQTLSPELQQAYRILSEFLLEKHRPLTAPFLRSWESQTSEPGQTGAPDFSTEENSGCLPCPKSQQLPGMWLLKMEEKFASGQYRGITDFVADFRLMLETCYRLHGVDHWLSKQAQKVEMMLEQKLALLSRLREQERKEAEEASQKEVEEWEKSLLSQAAPTRMENMWEIPAIGHFLCLAQHILNLPEIVFYELERCLLMPQCSPFLSKIMTSLLSPPHRRSTLHRRPSFPYRTWEAALKQKVQQWYTAVGQTDNPDSCAEKLGLCPQFFKVLGEVSPLEEKPFHELPFCQKVWLLKGLCDFTYETQKDVQDAVLGQPIHECREVILGYDYLEHAYVHFPQFCGADVRIYKQKPFHAPEFPIPPIKVKRVPRIKLEKMKCEYGTKSNGEIRFGAKEQLPHAKQEPGKNFCLAKVHLNLLNVIPEHEVKYNCEEKTHKDCDFTKDCCKENQDKGIVSEDGLGEPLSPGEIRILENKEKCGESSVVKIDGIPLKENTLKTCQMHVNGNQTDNPDFNCHKVAKEVTSKNSVEQKTLMFSKIRAKKKKKKKKKLKDILNESLQRKREIHLHSLKSYKPEIQNKLLMIKKKAKHKKHKSGKKSISKKAVTKKRKSITKPIVPEFQLICTNLDELRELIRKIENELKDIEHIKKKSGRCYHRKQAVKELHCTLIRLLNELLPWEPKLMKAFHRNRSRLKKDYDDFRRQPDHDKFTREQWTNEDSEINTVKEVSNTFTSETLEHTEVLKRDYMDTEDMKSPEMDLGSGKSRPFKKDLTCKEMQKIVPKSVKRQSKQNYYLDDSTNEFLPRKKLKLSTNDATIHSIENDLSTESCLNKQIESSASESLDMTDSTAYARHLIKGTKPIQALLAKNIGNKVALTSQLPSTVGRSTFTSEKLVISTVSSSPIKPELPCQTSSKNSLQVLYKMPAGHCMPVDLHNNSVKIQMQPLVDGKSGEKNTGEKIMQQVLILPKSFLIQHRENKSGAKENQPLQQNTIEQHCISLPLSTDTNTTLVPPIPTSSINVATTLLPITNVKKNITQLPQGADSVNRLSLLPSVTSTSNTLPSVVKMNQSETVKITKTVVSAASCPVASPIVSSTIQTLTTVSQSVTSYISSFPQNTADSETKQELKTICIRDSQSILVRTRGGNTGIVKVQTNSEPISASNFSPSVFTYAPQLQAFLMPKSTQLSTSTVSAVTKAIPNLPTLAQMSPATSSIPIISSCANPKKGKNTTVTFGHSHNSVVNQGVSKTLHGSSSPFLSSISSNIVMTAPPNSSGNAVSLSTENVGQSSPCTTQASFINQQVNVNNAKYSVAQPEVTSITSRSLGSTQVQKLMLVTNPSLLPVCGATGVNLIPTPTSTGVSAQKLVFINTPLAGIQSNASVTTEPLKQTFPPSIGKTYVKSTEQPQLVLLPSTVGSSLKVNTSPTVSQVKDVKIGLNIGQAFINSTGNAQNVSTVNIMQSTASKDLEDKNNHNIIFPLSTSSSLVPVCSSLACQSIAAKAVNTTTITSSPCLDTTSVALSGATTGTRSSILADGMEPPAKIIPVLTTRLSSSNVGSTVAISTVKTGHLASSVLISTAQPTISHSSLSSPFQLPVTVSLPGPVNGVPKMLQTVPPLPAIPPASQCVPHSKSQQSTLAQFQPAGISAGVPTNGSSQKLQKASPNASKVINFSNLVPLPCPSVPLNVKTAFSCAPGTSTVQTVPASPSVVNNVGSQLNESNIQQKIIINTCTPLAPGTQIMISGTRFIVPSQGLGAGSHVLLISANPKLGPLLTVSNGYGFQGVSFAAPTPQKTTQVMGNSLSWQPSKLPLKSSTKIVNSLGITNPVPIVHATPQIIANTSKSGTPSFATTLSTSLVGVTSSATQTKTTLVPATHVSTSQLQNSKSVLHLDTSIKKLMVSPEGAILNAIKTPTSETSSLSSSFSADLISTTRNSAVVFPNFLNSSIGVPDTAAS
ncbi:putative bromodomain-containing protein 10 isoform 2-T2 [Vipera latastei]